MDTGGDVRYTHILMW